MIQVAVALGIADSLHDGPKPATKLVADSGADANMVLRLCRALSAFGIFEVDSEDMVSQSARSAWLRKDARPTLHHAALYWMTPGSWSAWERLEHGIRTGACPFEEVFGQPYFSYLKQHPEEAALLDQHMQHSPDDRHAAVAEAYDFSGVRLVVEAMKHAQSLFPWLLRGVDFDNDSAFINDVVVPWCRQQTLEVTRSRAYKLAAVWTENGGRQQRVSKAVRCGQVFINCYGAGGGVELPFGGVKKERARTGEGALSS